jgi:hypothetical protein
MIKVTQVYQLKRHLKQLVRRVMLHCASADEAEAEACAGGGGVRLRLATRLCSDPMIVELDSTRILTSMKSNSLEGSELMCIILEAKEYLQCWWN